MHERNTGRREGTGFRADLEGLRAVAVVLVLLFHADAPGFAGGYVGVDVFFVLSGFLITGLLVRELSETGRISFADFYARRARRLLPAAAVALVGTAVLSAVLLPPLQMPDVVADIAAAAAYVSNIRFAVQATDYLASELPPSPVLHFWSLGVEEQFYLLWPALLALVAGSRFAVGEIARGTKRVVVTLIVVLLVSGLAAVWLTGVEQPWAFFSLPTRAWELALGGLIATPIAARVFRARAAAPLGWVGLALVALAGVVLNEATPFPGVAGLMPTLGSALVIGAGLPTGDRSLPGAKSARGPGWLLSLPPIRYVGRISYSLYLWHWPLLVLPAVAFGDLPGVTRLALVGAAAAIAAASHRWVEEPIRRGRFVGMRPRRVLAAAGTASLAVAILAVTLGAVTTARISPSGPTTGGNPEDVIASASPGAPSAGPTITGSPTPLPGLAAAAVPADLVPPLVAAKGDLPVIYSDGCHVSPARSEPLDCIFGDPQSSTTVVLWGDSHAAQWFPSLERLALERGWRLIAMTKSSCAALDIPVWSTLYNRPYDECTRWRANAAARLALEHPALVVISNDRRYPLSIDGAMAWSTDHEVLWAASLQRTLSFVHENAGAALVIGDTVRMSSDTPICLSKHLDNATACATPYEDAVAVARNARDAKTVAEVGATFLDPTPMQCATDPCPAVIGRFLVYRDAHHMTATYNRALAERLFENMIRSWTPP